MVDLSLGAKRTETSEEKILKALEEFKSYHLSCPEGCLSPETVEAFQVHVPKLLEAYAECWEMSMNLAAAWEQERAGITPTGLVLPK